MPTKQKKFKPISALNPNDYVAVSYNESVEGLVLVSVRKELKEHCENGGEHEADKNLA